MPYNWPIRAQVTWATNTSHYFNKLNVTSYIFILECVYLLLAHGAPVKLKNNFGWSPLAEAISYGDRQISKLLQLIIRLMLLPECVNLYTLYYRQEYLWGLDMQTRHTVVLMC